jgi:hypothetical protein
LIVTLCVATRVQAATYPIAYRLSHAGKVSVAVYDAKGVLVREMQRALTQEAGEHALIWDGLDANGKGVPAGRYVWKLLQTGGLSVQYLLSVGSNYPIGTDLSSSGGPGTHVAPFTVARDDTGVYVAALQTENIESGLIKLSPDGKTRVWSQKVPSDAKGQYVPWEGARSIAVDKGEVYLLGHLGRQRVHVSNAATGAPRRAFDVGWGSDSPDADLHAHVVAHGATDMDVANGTLVVAYKARNAVRWYDPSTGAVLGAAEVPAPSGVTVARDGTVYVSTGDGIARLTLRDRTPRTLISNLPRPDRLDVDDGSGDLLVHAGASQQVLRISASGILRQTYGASGGRKEGLYVDRDFDGVTDLCADGHGGFFVAEAYSAPRRVAHFSAAGAVVQEWYGGQRWAPSAVFEPGNPNAMWVTSAAAPERGVRYIMRVLINPDQRTWRVHSCYRYVAPENRLMSDSGNEGGALHVYEHDGVKYLATEGAPCIWRIDDVHWKLLPVTVVGATYQWNDANGDGLVQESEMIRYASEWHSTFLLPHLDARFDFYGIDRSHGCQVRHLAVTGWNSVGAPIYGTAPAGEPYAECPARFLSTPYADARWGAFLYHDTQEGSLYAALNPGTVAWCQSADSFVQRWSADGRMSWAVGEQGAASVSGSVAWYIPTAAGEIYRNLRSIAGVAHGCLVATDVDGGWTTERAQTYVWDRDGLFVGGIMDNPVRDGTPEFMYHCGGEFAHSAIYTMPDGDVYFAGNWENETRVYRVKGWDGAETPWVRSSGELTIQRPTPDDTGQGLTAESFRDASFTGPSVVRVKAAIVAEPRRAGATRAALIGVELHGAVRPLYGPHYVGNWTRENDAKASDGGFHKANNKGAQLSFKFRGTSVAVVRGPACGDVAIALDGVKVVAGAGGCHGSTPPYGAVVFERKGLKNGDHTLTMETVANEFTVDGFVVDGRPIDDDGMAYSFYMTSTHGAELWIDGKSVIKDWTVSPHPSEMMSQPAKLLRRDHPIELKFKAPGDASPVSLKWSTAFESKRAIPTIALFPAVRGHDR